MADEVASNAAAQPASSTPGIGNGSGAQTISLKIIQPSVPIPVVYKDLPVESTVKQLKERIRGDVAVGDQQLRLIYRGRVMDRDDATLLTVLGEAAIRESSELALHLILHPRPGAAPAASYTAQRPSSRPSSQPPPLNRPPAPTGVTSQPQQIPLNPAAHAQMHTQAHVQAHTRAHVGAHAHAQAMQQLQQQFGQPHAQQQAIFRQQQEHAMLRQQQMIQQHRQQQSQQQQEAHFRQMIGQNQVDRARAGLHGIQDMPPGTPGRNSPIPGQSQRTYVREQVGPDGNNWRVTVTESTIVTDATPMPGVPNPLQVWNNALNRHVPGMANARGTPLHGLSRAGSRTATPEPGQHVVPGHIPRSQPAPGGSEVYILMSPSGPQALLSHGTYGTYVSPGAGLPSLQLPQMPMGPLPQVMRIGPLTPQVVRPPTMPPVGDGQNIVQQWLQQPQQQPAAAAPNLRGGERPEAAGQLGQQNQPAQANPQAPIRPLHPNNNPNAAVAANIGHYIWLLVRIGLLIWWFTGPNTSWWRWATMIGVGIVILIVSSGILDGAANQAWQPIRRHIEGLLPRGLPANPPNRPAQPAAAGVAPANADPAAPRAPGQMPEPREVADRLVAERQQQDVNWVMAQVRRIERAGILFLASIVPGLAEGHVVMFEAEQRAERRRAEEAAAAAAREAEEAAANATTGDGEGGQETAGGAESESQPAPETTNDGPAEATATGVERSDAARRRVVGAEEHDV